jgi:hypothetical protein
MISMRPTLLRFGSLLDRACSAQIPLIPSNIFAASRFPAIINANVFVTNCPRAMSTNPVDPIVDHPSRSTKEYVSKQDEKEQVQAFLDSLPTCGISVSVYPGNNMDVAEKKLRRKVNMEGTLLKFRESKVQTMAFRMALSLKLNSAVV